MNKTFDPTWESLYSKGFHLNRYPFDSVVSFIYNYKPDDVSYEETKILEVGCGAANNLWFAAREGFNVSGVDASESAIRYARNRFKNDKLQGSLEKGDFTCLPFENNTFHLVIDRCATTHTSGEGLKKALSEVQRVLKPDGYFLFVAFADTHSSASSGQYDEISNTVDNVTHGSLVGVGQINFLSLSDIRKLIKNECWQLIKAERVESIDFAKESINHIQAEWRTIVKKVV